MSVSEKDSLFVRSALRTDLTNGDVVDDFFVNFLNAGDIDFPDIKRRNDSLTEGKAHSIQSTILEHDLKKIPFEKRRILLRDFITSFDWGSTASDSEIYLSKGILEYCHQRFADENQYLSKFFNNNSSFEGWYQGRLSAVKAESGNEIKRMSSEQLSLSAKMASEGWVRYVAEKTGLLTDSSSAF